MENKRTVTDHPRSREMTQNGNSFMPAMPQMLEEPKEIVHGVVSSGKQAPTLVEKDDRTDIIVAGSIAIDLSCDYAPYTKSSGTSPRPLTSNPAVIEQSIGGVGNNVATAAHLAGGSVRLCSLVGDDLGGRTILAALEARSLDIGGIKVLDKETGRRTAQYVAVNDSKKDLVLAMADMSIIDTPTADFATLWQPKLDAAKPKWLVIDGNWNPRTLKEWIMAGKASGAKVAFEPVSDAKSAGIFPLKAKNTATSPVYPTHQIDLATPNRTELAAIHAAAKAGDYLEQQDWWHAIDSLGIPSSGARDRFVALTNKQLVDEGVPQRTIQLLPFIPIILTKLGADGVLLTLVLGHDDRRLTSREDAPYILSRCTNGSEIIGGVYMRLFPAVETVPEEEVVSVNGVGDTFLGVLIAGLAEGKDIVDLVDVAQRGAVMTLRSKEAVHPRLEAIRSSIRNLSSSSSG